jgi:formyl-CoA transferase
MLEVDGLIEAWTRGTSKQEIADRLLEEGVPCAPVRDLDQVATDENMLARGTLQWVNHPTLGQVTLPHSPLRFCDEEPVALEASHALGADNQIVYGDWLGRTDDQLAELEKDGVI